MLNICNNIATANLELRVKFQQFQINFEYVKKNEFNIAG